MKYVRSNLNEMTPWLQSVLNNHLDPVGITDAQFEILYRNIVHDLKTSALQLAESENIFKSFMNNSHCPAWILDEDGIIIYMNDLFKEVWNLSDIHLQTNLYDHIPAEMAQEYITNNKTVIDSGVPLITVENSFRTDGTPGIYLVHKFLLQTSHDKRLIGGQSTDITDERRAHEEIAKSNERFYYATQATSDSIWDWNIEAGHIYRSDSFTRLTGYEHAKIGNNLFWWYERIHHEDRERVMQQINSCILAHNSYWKDEYRFRCADGTYKYLSDKGFIIYKKGEPVRAIGAIQDLTEKRRLEAELAFQKEQERIQINQAIISAQDHERNEISKELHDNVNQILSSASILLSAIKGNDHEMDPLLDKTNQYINMAIQEIRKLSKALNTSVISEVGLEGPVQEIVENMRLVQNLDVQFEYDEELEDEITADVQLNLFRIIQEQTNNIVRHAEATHVVIAIKKVNNVVRLTIDDNGNGFDLKQKVRGIGLINIRNRVEVMGGALQITTQPGKGCRMVIGITIQKN
jgi:PAS domain S-box-containing protein